MQSSFRVKVAVAASRASINVSFITQLVQQDKQLSLAVWLVCIVSDSLRETQNKTTNHLFCFGLFFSQFTFKFCFVFRHLIGQLVLCGRNEKRAAFERKTAETVDEQAWCV